MQETAGAQLEKKTGRVIVFHITGEIGVKGNNRGMFEQALKQNLEKAVKDLPTGGIRREDGRFVLRLTPDSPAEEIVERIRSVPGISSFSNATELPPEEAAIAAEVSKMAAKHTGSFKIATRRSDKKFPFNSPEINGRLGQLVVDQTGREVDLSAPEHTYHVEICANAAFVYDAVTRGGGGLPVGTLGRVVALTSGGIDSPVAAWEMIHRGCKVEVVHCINVIPDRLDVLDKLTETCSVLARVQGPTRLHLVPFGELQGIIVAAVPAKLRMLIYRRLMVKIAEKILLETNSKAIITGDSVGQVASQTLENLRATFTATDWPLLCPLSGHSKQQIVNRAKEIGTYAISIQPGEDCCTFMVAKHPSTHASYENILKYDRLDTEGAIIDAVAKRRISIVHPNWSRAVIYGDG